MRQRLTREGFTLAPLAGNAWLGLRRANARQSQWIRPQRVKMTVKSCVLLSVISSPGTGSTSTVMGTF
jgi:hypothetical protein